MFCRLCKIQHDKDHDEEDDEITEDSIDDETKNKDLEIQKKFNIKELNERQKKLLKLLDEDMDGKQTGKFVRCEISKDEIVHAVTSKLIDYKIKHKVSDDIYESMLETELKSIEIAKKHCY